MKKEGRNIIDKVTQDDYKYGFVTPVETEMAAVGLNEDTIRYISSKKNEPAFLLEFRLQAYKKWLEMKEPTWAKISYPPIDFQKMMTEVWAIFEHKITIGNNSRALCAAVRSG